MAQAVLYVEIKTAASRSRNWDWLTFIMSACIFTYCLARMCWNTLPMEAKMVGQIKVDYRFFLWNTHFFTASDLIGMHIPNN